MSFIFAADLHVDWTTWVGNKNIIGDSIASFELVLSAARNHGNCPVVLGGDVFDTKLIDPFVASEIQGLLCSYNDIPVYYIQGNHDSTETGWLDVLADTSLRTRQVYRLTKDPIVLPDGEVLCGIDFQLSDSLNSCIDAVYKGCDALIMHQTFKCFNSCGYAVDWSLVDQFNMILAGDYHIPCEYRTEKGTVILSPGSTNRRSIIEPAPSVIFVENAKKQIYERVNLQHRQMCVMDIESTVEQVVDAFVTADPTHIDPDYEWRPAYIAKPMLVLRGKITKEAREFWKNTFPDKYHLLFSPTVVKEEGATEVTATESIVVRGSRQYISNILQEYPAASTTKRLATDYVFGDSQRFLKEAKSRFDVNEQEF